MMAVRARAVKVMAALERRLPGLDEFVGQSWTAWAQWAGVTATDGPDVDDCSKNGKKTAEAMSLSKDDMSIFGLHPGHDDFYLVVCGHCGQVVKPQAFEKHCERRHGPLAKLHPRLRSPAPPAAQLQPRAQRSHSPSPGTNAAPSPAWDGRGQGVRPPWVAPPSPSAPSQYRHLKNPKDGPRHPLLDKTSHADTLPFKAPAAQEPPVSSPPHEAPPPTPAQRKESPLASPVCSPRLARPYNKVASKRECDLDKHCGVLDHERKKVCTRLLTCNIHSIHQRRKVVGRTKSFDQLVAELKTKVREKGPQLAEGGSGAGRSPSPETHRELCEAPPCRRPLASLPAFCRSLGASESPTEEEEEEKQQQQDERHLRASSPMLLGCTSSDDSEAEAAQERLEFSSSAVHPRPMAVCSFGSHALGHGIYTFDRRLHHLRSTLSTMLEQHISALLWKKIPQASDSRWPQPSVRTPLSSSAASTSPLNSRVPAGGQQFSSFRSFPEASPSSRGPGRPGATAPSENWVQADGPCLPGPPHRRPREEAGARKRKASSQAVERPGLDRNCVSLLPHGQTNGTHSPGSRPRPQPAPSEAKGLWTYARTHSSSSNSSHARGMVGGALLKKRRGEEHVPSLRAPTQGPPSSSVLAPPRPNFYPWKESKSAGLAGGAEKKLGTPKPRLHH
ncbi:ataxin-7-like protein 2a isoform X2 [Synchiropus splendidus]|uniref:ataxin-7-like protein 2a isoform X2 n=1 Tax=Synchiropus splendidus TaxID=270530 RepID=UPI00237E0C75|nr:ataxin-7-like protein 2a isoform X2 [Synchiropus splendidus]